MTRRRSPPARWHRLLPTLHRGSSGLEGTQNRAHIIFDRDCRLPGNHLCPGLGSLSVMQERLVLDIFDSLQRHRPWHLEGGTNDTRIVPAELRLRRNHGNIQSLCRERNCQLPKI